MPQAQHSPSSSKISSLPSKQYHVEVETFQDMRRQILLEKRKKGLQKLAKQRAERDASTFYIPPPASSSNLYNIMFALILIFTVAEGELGGRKKRKRCAPPRRAKSS